MTRIECVTFRRDFEIPSWSSNLHVTRTIAACLVVAFTFVAGASSRSQARPSRTAASARLMIMSRGIRSLRTLT